MKLLEGKVAVVTGAARGIGKAIALKFAQEGANIAFTDLVIDENGLATQAEIEALGVKAKGYASNAANFEETHNVVAEIVKDFGRIDILVNNAGITKDGLMMRMSEGQWDAVLNVNLKSAFNFIHACTPVMMKQRAGSIINMSSVVGVHGNAGQANYSASKAGMIGLAKSVGKIYSRFETNGLKIVAAQMRQLSQAEAEGFYAVHRERPFFADLVKFMTSGPVMIQVLEGENAILKNRELMGATDPKKAAAGTIRADFAESIDANAVHGSDAPETAAVEIAYFFPTLAIHSR